MTALQLLEQAEPAPDYGSRVSLKRLGILIRLHSPICPLMAGGRTAERARLARLLLNRRSGKLLFLWRGVTAWNRVSIGSDTLITFAVELLFLPRFLVCLRESIKKLKEFGAPLASTAACADGLK